MVVAKKKTQKKISKEVIKDQKIVANNEKEIKDEVEDEEGVSEENEGRIRKCLKNKPLSPLDMGDRNASKPQIKVSVRRKIRKPSKSKRIKASSTSGQKNRKPSTLMNRSPMTVKNGPAKANSVKNKPNFKNGTKNAPSVNVESAESGVQVVFQPASGCEACADGRKGEGDKSCWSCRLARLQSITEKIPSKV